MLTQEPNHSSLCHFSFHVAAFVLAVFLGLPTLRAQSPDEEVFERRIRPILAARCYECHSVAAEKEKGGLVLDIAQRARSGGDSGSPFVAKDGHVSVFERAITYVDTELQMPPAGKLPQAELDLLLTWARAGAFFPEPSAAPALEKKSTPGFDPVEAARRHWSFRAPAVASITPKDGETASATSIDGYIDRDLVIRGISPVPRADSAALLRRLSFDLRGLPPTPDEVRKFSADPSAHAYEAMVDQYLASPGFGEHWARKWLDLVRYADSNGLDENHAMAFAWRYRDWVIRAFNRDLPYSDFVTWQLAGDLLPEPDDPSEMADRLIATGFLTLGPKMLAEQDKNKLVMDTIDEVIDVTSKTFLGMTIACARCHDHKFDPISAEDYYGLAGIFKSTRLLSNVEFVSRWGEVELARKDHIAARDRVQSELDTLNKELETLKIKTRRIVEANLREMTPAILKAAALSSTSAVVLEAEAFARGNLLRDRKTWGRPDVEIVRTGNGDRPQWAEYDLAALPAGSSGSIDLLVRYASNEMRPVRVLWDGVLLSSDALTAPTGSFHPEGQVWRPVASVRPEAKTHVLRIEADGNLPHIDAFLFVRRDETDESIPAEVVAAAAARFHKSSPEERRVLGLLIDAASLPAIGFSDEVQRRGREMIKSGELPAFLSGVLNGQSPMSFEDLAARIQVALSTAFQLVAGDQPAEFEKKLGAHPQTRDLVKFWFGISSLYYLDEAALMKAAPVQEANTLTELTQRRDDLKKRLPPPFDRALGVRDKNVEETPIHIRGSHLNLAPKLVSRRSPRVLSTEVDMPPLPPDQSGRRELAEWLTHPDHPLTARVLVNRLWEGMFGRGLVESSSNFGLRGDLPTHPELLDFLARDFVRRGWSMKAMLKQIVLSSTYQRSVGASESGEKLDPENRLLWRQNRRRLSAEGLRDSILAAATTLDHTQGGTLLTTANGDYVTNDQSNNAAQYNHLRRTIYLPVVRNALFDLWSTFDYPDAGMPVERRSQTVDANQALFLMNAPFVVEQSSQLARRVLANASLSHDERIHEVYWSVLGRAPTQQELDITQHFLGAANDNSTAEEPKWRRFVHALFSSNAFLYLD